LDRLSVVARLGLRGGLANFPRSWRRPPSKPAGCGSRGRFRRPPQLAFCGMAQRRCALCGAPVASRRRNAKCDRCRRRASYRRVRHGELDDEDTDAGRLEVRHRLAAASHVEKRCKCSNPLGLVDECGEARCVKCGPEMPTPIRTFRGHEFFALPPAT
jgi:hypothetical protein